MAPVPKTQRAVQVSNVGGPEVLQVQSVPIPEVGPSSVLIKNHFAGINYIDTYFRTGLYPSQTPFIPGQEGEGEVVAVGKDVQGFKEGDRVVFWKGTGSYAEYSVASAENTFHLKSNIPDGHGVAAFLQGLTALSLVKDVAEVKPGQWVVVTAAAGGVGVFLVQILKKYGAKIIATASTEEKRKLVKDLGADYALPYEKWDEEVLKITGGEGASAIIDGVGKDTFDGAVNAVGVRGIIATFGNSSGKVPPIDIYRLSEKSARVIRPRLFSYVRTREEAERYVTELYDWINSGEAKIFIHKVYPLAESAQAHRDIESRGTIGKLLIDPRK